VAIFSGAITLFRVTLGIFLASSFIPAALLDYQTFLIIAAVSQIGTIIPGIYFVPPENQSDSSPEMSEVTPLK